MTKRQAKIITMLNEKERLEVTALAEHLHISTVTVRKDLVALERQGLLRRRHGYAMRVSQDDIGWRMAFAYEVKKRIAERAAQMVNSGDSIMIESGSTCAMLAVDLAEKKHDITIITNSAYIAETIRRLPGAKAILLGGSYDSEAQVTTGPLISVCAEKFFVDQFFIGTDGFNVEQGFFGNTDLLRAEAVAAMGKFARKKIILTDSSKFGKRSVVKLLSPEELTAVVTDAVPEDCRRVLEQKGMDVILA